jgi:hypothetical protein
MSSNGTHRNLSQSPARPFSPAILNSLADGTSTSRSSTDSEPSTGTGATSSGAAVNGTAYNYHGDDQVLDPLERLQRQLDHEREEKENLASQYRNLLAKLTTMRTTLGNKLKQDAVRAALFPMILPHERSDSTSLPRKNSIVANYSSKLCPPKMRIFPRRLKHSGLNS